MNHQIILFPKKNVFKNDSVKKDISNKNLKKFLFDNVELVGATPRRLLELISSDLNFWCDIFGDLRVMNLIDEFRRIKKKVKNENLNCLQFSWFVESFYYEEDFKLKENINDDFNIHLALYGIGCNKKEKVSFDISLTPIVELLDVKLEINSEVNVLTNFVETGSCIYLGCKKPTLLEVMRSFIMELTFSGSEKEKKEFIEMIDKRIDDIKNTEKFEYLPIKRKETLEIKVDRLIESIKKKVLYNNESILKTRESKQLLKMGNDILPFLIRSFKRNEIITIPIIKEIIKKEPIDIENSYGSLFVLKWRDFLQKNYEDIFFKEREKL